MKKIISTSSENANLNDKTDNLQQTLEEINLKLKEDEIDLDKEREKVSQLSCKLLKQEEEFKTQFLENEEMVSKLDKIACDLMEKKIDEANHLKMELEKTQYNLVKTKEELNELLYQLSEKEEAIKIHTKENQEILSKFETVNGNLKTKNVENDHLVSQCASLEKELNN